ncbi:MAG TPA: hypothetical protein VNB24_07395 [Acidimicrobiales bacterium]|nr:hypothetical protein [Acidimicrobiales bacterium]
MTDESNFGGFGEETAPLVVQDPPAPRRGRTWVPLVIGGVALLVLGVLIGLAVDRDEPDSQVAVADTARTTSTTTSTPVDSASVPTTEGRSIAGATASPPRPTTTVRRTSGTPSTTVRSVTTTRPADRVVGRAAGGGSGNGATTISFEVAGKWRIDHRVQGAEATITVIDRAAGYSFSYTAPVGSGSRVFDRTCGCRVVVSSPEGTYDVTVVDTAD